MSSEVSIFASSSQVTKYSLPNWVKKNHQIMIGLRLFENGLLGCREANTTKLFVGSDNEPKYNKNLRLQPDDWYYRNCNISYRYNSHGHRCHEIDEIDFDNYILFVGDSHAEGVGLELERTFPYLTAKKLGISYYNMGLGATGIDYMLFNVLTWISRYPLPKYIFQYWSHPTRYLRMNPARMPDGQETLDPMMIDQRAAESEQHFLVHGEMAGYFRSKLWLTSNLLKNAIDNNNIPFYNFHCGDPNTHYNSPLIEKVLSNFNFDYARDEHHGIETHNAISDLLCEKFNQLKTLT